MVRTCLTYGNKAYNRLNRREVDGMSSGRAGTRTALFLAGFAAACSGRTDGAVARPDGDKESGMKEEAGAGERPVRQLPYAHGRTFATLDEYLAHRRRGGAIDLPWYREIRPGVYELVTTRVPRGEPRIYTREELMRQFGFTR